VVKLDNLAPRVLVATPVSERHKHLLDSWLDNLNNLTYSNFDVLLVDTTSDTDRYYNLLKTKKVKGKKIKVLRNKWNYKKHHVVQMLARAREKIRKYFLDRNYKFLFSLDDDIFVPEWSIQRLVSYDKDCVGFYVHVYFKPNRKPCILKTGEIIMGKGLNYFSFAEINAYKKFVKKFREGTLTKEEKLLVPFLIKDVWHPQLAKVYGVNLGCLMIKRKVLEDVPFRTHPSFIYGEDLWFFAEANDKKYEFWVDTNVRAIHKNTEWRSLMKKGPKLNTNFYIALGPANADKLFFVRRK